jgi:hypothetical protein
MHVYAFTVSRGVKGSCDCVALFQWSYCVYLHLWMASCYVQSDTSFMSILIMGVANIAGLTSFFVRVGGFAQIPHSGPFSVWLHMSKLPESFLTHHSHSASLQALHSSSCLSVIHHTTLKDRKTPTIIPLLEQRINKCLCFDSFKWMHYKWV